MQHVHFQIRVGVFNCQEKDLVSLILWQKKQIESGLAWCIVISTMIHVITVVKICYGLARLHLVSPEHFDYCDDAYHCR